MQTFLPYPSFEASAQALDNTRLNKQLVECQQILMILHGELECYKTHPAVRMWAGHEQCLCFYASVLYSEWQARRKKPSCHKSADTVLRFFNGLGGDNPWWVGTREIHETHQSRLMHKGNVDVLKTRFGKVREQKRNYLTFRETYNKIDPDFQLPNEWYLLLPDEVRRINNVLDSHGHPAATKTNHYNFNIGPDHAYIWPTEEGGFKTKPCGEWKPWQQGDELPYLIGR